MGPETDQQTAYEDLANAIIERAANDYELALIKRRTGEAESLEKFFKSEYYAVLTNVYGDYIIDGIREKVSRRCMGG